jgi:hypothetical protein
MGYLTELNTLLGLPKEFDILTLKIGNKYIITKDRERAFPLHIAILMVTSDWNFLGYAVAHSAKNYDQKCDIEFDVISLFNPQEQNLYKSKFLEAAKLTGEVK